MAPFPDDSVDCDIVLTFCGVLFLFIFHLSSIFEMNRERQNNPCPHPTSPPPGRMTSRVGCLKQIGKKGGDIFEPFAPPIFLLTLPPLILNYSVAVF